MYVINKHTERLTDNNKLLIASDCMKLYAELNTYGHKKVMEIKKEKLFSFFIVAYSAYNFYSLVLLVFRHEEDDNSFPY